MVVGGCLVCGVGMRSMWRGCRIVVVRTITIMRYMGGVCCVLVVGVQHWDVRSVLVILIAVRLLRLRLTQQRRLQLIIQLIIQLILQPIQLIQLIVP